MPKHDLKPRLQLDDKGRILLPKIIREELQLKPGALMEAEIYGEKILLTILRR
jgi:AbrB family looped-hinge helix DNA binding protein